MKHKRHLLPAEFKQENLSGEALRRLYLLLRYLIRLQRCHTQKTTDVSAVIPRIKNRTRKTTRGRYRSSDWLPEVAAGLVLHPSTCLIGCRPFNERTN